MSLIPITSDNAGRMKVQLLSLNAYDRHKKLINDYLLCRKGATALLQRDTSRDKRDIDVIRENHKFLWEETDEPRSWGENLAKKYYDKLFKEYCICDLRKFKENKVALRWRIEKEVVDGKGQFVCGDKACSENESLRSWEVNFAYQEGGEKKNALVKLRLCPSCSQKLNYHSQKREVMRKKRKSSANSSESLPKRRKQEENAEGEDQTRPTQATLDPTVFVKAEPESEEEPESSNIWKGSNVVSEEEKSRDEEFEEYLQDLFM
ncbi:protein FRA10AC1 homolog [Ischnura elegans]|uniref:protein FRA10AC1 homolog n=1 Tax=Ischnura elegans TaxID=197161 RepID=UPI001ED87734|nr:protein FRA10AC1 homolog [Ischnura elegans]XP_046391141.1 protein FRA10AC1 homolog [Ischnura elegans]XP_046391142.1 protein FRA10AC1 homolog [Ischnura elegans]